MEQIERIKEMESILSEGETLFKDLDLIINKINEYQNKLNELEKYYSSKTYMDDLNDYDNKLINQNIKAGIFSEDAIYDLLTSNDAFKKYLKDYLKSDESDA